MSVHMLISDWNDMQVKIKSHLTLNKFPFEYYFFLWIALLKFLKDNSNHNDFDHASKTKFWLNKISKSEQIKNYMQRWCNIMYVLKSILHLKKSRLKKVSEKCIILFWRQIWEVTNQLRIFYVLTIYHWWNGGPIPLVWLFKWQHIEII